MLKKLCIATALSAALMLATALPLGAADTTGTTKTAPKAKKGQAVAAKKKGFDRLDANKDGMISKAEWEAAKRKPEVFDTIDTNKDGNISREEWNAHIKNRSMKPAAAKEEAKTTETAPAK